MDNRFDKVKKLNAAFAGIDLPSLETGKLGTGLPECEPTFDYVGCDDFPELENGKLSDTGPWGDTVSLCAANNADAP